MQKLGGAFSLLDTEPFISSSNSDYSLFFPNNLNGSNVIYFETGSDSLSYLIKEICKSNSISEIYFPMHYCQNTIERIKLKNSEINILKYECIDKLVVNKPAILLWNHFNKYQEINKSSISENLFLIEDFVHAPYDMKKSVSRHCFNSLRKVCNIDVSVCYSPSQNELIFSETTSYYLKRKEAELTKYYCQKIGYNRLLEDKFLLDISKSELLLFNNNVCLANELEVYKFKHVSHSRIYKTRLENYRFVKSKLNVLGYFEIIDGDYMYLMLNCKKRDILKKQLANKNIFTTCHWADSENEEKANNLISIYIDQRYSQNQLEYLTDQIIKLYDC